MTIDERIEQVRDRYYVWLQKQAQLSIGSDDYIIAERKCNYWLGQRDALTEVKNEIVVR